MGGSGGGGEAADSPSAGGSPGGGGGGGATKDRAHVALVRAAKAGYDMATYTLGRAYLAGFRRRSPAPGLSPASCLQLMVDLVAFPPV